MGRLIATFYANRQPIADCVMSTWSEWSYGCSAACAGGVNTRERVVLIPESNGGNCTASSTGTRPCNMQACRSPPASPGMKLPALCLGHFRSFLKQNARPPLHYSRFCV